MGGSSHHQTDTCGGFGTLWLTRIRSRSIAWAERGLNRPDHCPKNPHQAIRFRSTPSAVSGQRYSGIE